MESFSILGLICYFWNVLNFCHVKYFAAWKILPRENFATWKHFFWEFFIEYSPLTTFHRTIIELNANPLQINTEISGFFRKKFRHYSLFFSLIRKIKRSFWRVFRFFEMFWKILPRENFSTWKIWPVKTFFQQFFIEYSPLTTFHEPILNKLSF